MLGTGGGFTLASSRPWVSLWAHLSSRGSYTRRRASSLPRAGRSCSPSLTQNSHVNNSMSLPPLQNVGTTARCRPSPTLTLLVGARGGGGGVRRPPQLFSSLGSLSRPPSFSLQCMPPQPHRNPDPFTDLSFFSFVSVTLAPSNAASFIASVLPLGPPQGNISSVRAGIRFVFHVPGGACPGVQKGLEKYVWKEEGKAGGRGLASTFHLGLGCGEGLGVAPFLLLSPHSPPWGQPGARGQPPGLRLGGLSTWQPPGLMEGTAVRGGRGEGRRTCSVSRDGTTAWDALNLARVRGGGQIKARCV